MKNTKRILILLLVLGVLVFGFPVAGVETISPGSDNASAVTSTGNGEANESADLVTESHMTRTEGDMGVNGTINQTLSPQVFVVMAAPAFSDSTTSRKIMMVSNTSTLSAGYIETEPVTRLDPASYSNHGWLPSANPVNHPYWHSNITDPYGDGAQWISSRNTTEGGYGDQWRLFKTDFDFPQGATLISAQLWYSPDNTVSVYLNDAEINSTGWVYGPRPPDYPNFYSYAYTVNFTPRTGSNTLKFVVRNWETTIYNPTGLLYKVMLEYEHPLAANFTGKPVNGTKPLTVYFNDTSTGFPTSWNWSFGDGTFSNVRNASHTYITKGNYTVSLKASKDVSSSTATKEGFVTVSDQGPSANFTAYPTTGVFPLQVQFSDTSLGSPNLKSWTWNWNFGDGETSTLRNPSHRYNSEGNYTVSLTVTVDKKGSDTETKEGYILVRPALVNYHVFSDGVSLYHGLDLNEDLPEASLVSQYFYNAMTTGQGRCHVDDATGTNYCWDGVGNPVDDATGSKFWNRNELADSIGANSAEFVFHAGHGWLDGIVFGTFNSNKNVTRSEMRFSRAKWIAFDSCEFVNESGQYDWGSVFDGAHIIMGFDTWGKPHRDQGPQFVARMRGESYMVVSIRDAWKFTIQDITRDNSLKGGYVWALPSQDDYLPGYGDFKEPVKSNGQYVINWTYFVCAPDQMG